MSDSAARRFLPTVPRKASPTLVKIAEQKAMTGMVHDGRRMIVDMTSLLPATGHDYAKDIGDGLGSSVLAAALNWIGRNFPEAPLVVERRLSRKQWEEVEDHPVADLLLNPNPFYSGDALLTALSIDVSFGNGYLLKLRNALNRVIQLWWVPRQLMTPRYPSDGSAFISHYDYRPNGQTHEIDVKDVVHIRFGMDPRNPRLGLSQLGSLVREVAIDDLAANFTGAILRNLGIVGLVVSPKTDSAAVNDPEAVKEVKAYLKANLTGDKRGDALVLGAPTDVNLLQYNLQGFDVGPIRDVSEERVCAAIGIPAAVIGFGTGLQQTKVGATMREMRQLAWHGGIMPMQRMVQAEITRSLLSEFESDTKRMRCRFDTDEVRALWESPTEKADRVRKDFQAGLIKRGRALLETGRASCPPDEDVYLVPMNVSQPGEPGANKPASAGDSED